MYNKTMNALKAKQSVYFKVTYENYIKDMWVEGYNFVLNIIIVVM